MSMGNRSMDFHRIELMHSWGFALREGVFGETNEGTCLAFLVLVREEFE